MNGKNLNVRYRRANYTKKRIKVIVAICAAAVAVIALLLLIFGNAFRRAAEERGEDVLGNQNDTVVDITVTVPSANGYVLSLSNVNAGTNVISDYASHARGLGGNTLAFAARDSSGKEIYSSTIAQNTGKQQSNSGYVTLKNIKSGAGSLRTSAGVDVEALGTNDRVYRSVLLSYDAGVCAELYLGGVDDVFIRITNGEINGENVSDLLRFVDSVKSIDSEAVIGLALPKSFFGEENADVVIHELAEKFDFLLYDITGYTENDGDMVDYVSSSIDIAQLYIMMYDMRVLLPSADDGTLENMIVSLRSKSIDNWQVYLP